MILGFILSVIAATLIGLFIGMNFVSTPALNSFESVKEFHQTFGHPVAATPTLIPEERSSLRIALIEEEFQEYKDAVAAGDLVAVADALSDMDYVVNGAAVEHGVNLPVLTAEVHRSNMSKLGADGKPIYREDGKIMKGENYTPPNIEGVLAALS